MLNEILRIAFSFGTLIVGWFLVRSSPALVLAAMRVVLAAIAALLSLLVVTGILHSTQGEVHRWSGHLLTIIVWEWVVFSIGAVWGRWWPRLGAILGRTGLLIVCISLTLLASMSGFLGPFQTDAAGVESHNRFVVLHYFVLPILLLLSLGLFSWWEMQRRK